MCIKIFKIINNSIFFDTLITILFATALQTFFFGLLAEIIIRNKNNDFVAIIEEKDAKQRELYLKGGNGKKEIEVMLQSYFEKTPWIK